MVSKISHSVAVITPDSESGDRGSSPRGRVPFSYTPRTRALAASRADLIPH